jgi:putative phosphotransacetylase
MKKILVETSARHIHLTQEAFEKVFGKGQKLDEKHVKKELSQPGQFASDIKLKVVGPKGELTASILGPLRNINQVELSLTDARAIGVSAPIRESGDIAGSAPVKIVGPAGEIDIPEGCIIAKRHVHMTPEDAKEFGVTNGQIVSIKVTGTGRDITFGDVVVRVSPKFALACHIDTDESNAGACFGVVYGDLIK